MEELIPFLIACPLVFLAGLVDAIAGGGGLISLPAYFMTGLPAHICLGTNKMSSSMGTALATFKLAKQGYIQWRKALICAALALVGSAIGASVALFIGDELLRWIMVVVIPCTAAYLLWPKSLHEAEREYPFARGVAIACVISFGIGMYDGFYGPGTGTFLMLAFVAFAHFGLTESAGITKVVNLTTNVSALTVFLINGQVWLLLGLVAGLFNMLGAWIGVNLFTGKGVRIVKPIMLCVMGVFLVKTVLELLGVV